MMVRESTAVKPSVIIYVKPHGGQEAKVREVQAGLEEEGIPSVLRSGDGDAVGLAHRGAVESQLEVGVGVDADTMSVHMRKLPSDKPLFVSADRENPIVWRHLGYNAARLVKGIPFKVLPEKETGSIDGSGDLECRIADVVRKLLLQKL
ncbi:MAG: dehydratase medium subunit [Firmicutes bacterium]|nr:dehydratase medium subunit [Bacillota bacterium]